MRYGHHNYTTTFKQQISINKLQQESQNIDYKVKKKKNRIFFQFTSSCGDSLQDSDNYCLFLSFNSANESLLSLFITLKAFKNNNKGFCFFIEYIRQLYCL